MRVVLGHLFPEHLNIYADRGNVAVLVRRAGWRGIDVEVRGRLKHLQEGTQAWEIEYQRRHHEGARVWTYYRVKKWTPWPDNIRDAITAEERRRRSASHWPPSGA